MNRKLFFFIACALFLMTSCRKFSCECTTTYYDNNGYYLSSKTEKHIVKAMTIFRASSKCVELESNDTDCYLD